MWQPPLHWALPSNSYSSICLLFLSLFLSLSCPSKTTSVAFVCSLFFSYPLLPYSCIYIYLFLDNTIWEDERQAGRLARPSHSLFLARNASWAFPPKECLLTPSRLLRLRASIRGCILDPTVSWLLVTCLEAWLFLCPIHFVQKCVFLVRMSFGQAKRKRLAPGAETSERQTNT